MFTVFIGTVVDTWYSQGPVNRKNLSPAVNLSFTNHLSNHCLLHILALSGLKIFQETLATPW